MKKTSVIIILGFLIVSCSLKPLCGVFYDSKEEILKYKSNPVLIEFIDPQPKEKIADIGAGSMQWEAIMMAFRDSLTFYCEDIDTLCNNKAQLKRVMDNVNKLRNGQSFSRIIQVIGNERGTNLETNFFDKVLIINTFHEFSNRQEMIKETHRILKSGGKIYIEERLPYQNKTIHQGCRKPMVGENELKELMEKNGFKLVDKRMMKYSFPDQIYCFQKN
jgi:ubiquinone/menaquinone biosynthesis C-methylase UbiE